MRAPFRSSGPVALPESDRRGDAPHPRDQLRLFGHGWAERLFLDAYHAGRVPHAWIIGGREGIGKATLAWRVARFLLAHPDPTVPAVAEARTLDVGEHEPAARLISTLAAPNIALLRREWNGDARPPKHFSVIRVDEVRTAMRRFRLSAADGGWRIAIIDTADDLNPQAANALLKIIEEPPPRCLFLLVSHEPGRLLPTIRSRCRRLMLRPLAGTELAAALRSLGQEPNDLLLQEALGSVGTALKLAHPTGSRIAENVRSILRRAPAFDWAEIAGLADRIAPARAEAEFEDFKHAVYGHLHDEVRRRAKADPTRVAPLAQVWEQFETAVRTTESLNLDKRPLVLSFFEELGAAAQR